MAQILVIDDEVGIRELLSEILTDEGHQVLLAENAQAARKLREHGRPDLVLLDIWMPDTDGISLLKEWAASGQLTMPVVMMSGHGTIETAVEATRIGAMDFLEKPIALQRLLGTVKRALRNQEIAGPQPLAIAALGRSAALAELKKRLAQVATVGTPLLLRGERGMQAELFARFLLAAGAPFLAGAEMLAEPPSEVLARAAGGILFIPDLSQLARIEQKNLEFLLARSERNRARVVTYSPVEPRLLVERHEYDPDLAARLSELTLALPPLRAFAEDIPDIASLILVQLVEARVCPARRFSTASLNGMRQHAWPGNLAELEAVVRSLALTSLDEEVQFDDFERVISAYSAPQTSGELQLDRPYRDARETFEKLYFEYQLAREHGSMSRIAERTGLERTHLYRKLKALGISPGGKKDEE
ncbi:MAG: sigma-54-dependent Fis family transcriptional regulator [Betaproteobacteria bacterium]|nr:sigma-54-dependent Fis family transcriptional regulator [Betaproteobacteria bacterium]